MRFLPLERKTYDKMQRAVYNLQLRKFKGLNFTILMNVIMKDTAPVHVHNPKSSSGRSVVSLYAYLKKGIKGCF